MSGDDDWGFLDKHKRARIGEETSDDEPVASPTPPAQTPRTPKITPKLTGEAPSSTAKPPARKPLITPKLTDDTTAPATPRITPKITPKAQAHESREHGEFRAQMTGVSLKHRALPIAVSLAAISIIGLLTEVVASSQMLTLLGPRILLVMYPLGGLGLLLIAIAQSRYVDHQARLPMLRAVSIGYAVAFGVAVALIAGSVWPAVAVCLVWLLADQLNFLMPLLLWSLAGDEFNVAEGRKIFGWIITWTYVGQIAGLTVATFSPPVLDRMDIPLTALLVLNPVVCLAIAIWLPRVMRDSAAAKGSETPQTTRQAVKTATEFVWSIPVWRSLLVGSLLTFMSGMTIYMTYSALADRLIPDDAGELQMYLGGVGLAAFGVCWLVQATVAEKLQERIGIPGVLLILPFAAVAGGILLLVATGLSSLSLAAVGAALWLIPRWSIDENARRGALSLVPDERRARVSFIVDLMPMVVGLIASAPLAALAILTDQYWIAFLVAVVLALAAIPFGFRVRRGWDDSMLNWRLRRRKRNRTADFGLEDT